MLGKHSDFALADKIWMKKMCHNCVPQLGNHTGRKTKQRKQQVKAYETNTSIL